MNKHIFLGKAHILTISSLVILSGCTNTAQLNTTASETTTNQSEVTVETTDAQTNKSETIEFGDSITASAGVTIDGDTATITDSGSYNLSGTATNKYLVIDDQDLDIELTFNNLSITSDLAFLQVTNAASLTINLNGESSITDSSSNQELQAPIYIDEVETHFQGEGTLNLTGNCQEGLESNNDLYFESGTYNITAVDDGINVGDNLIINDGTITIDSNGDGLDSNGSLEINGGTIYVSGGNNGNGPIDFAEEDGETFKLTGGTLVAVGGNMGVSTTEETQTTKSGTANGTTIKVGDLEWTAPKTFSYYFVSTPDLTADTEITVDGNSTTDTTGQATGMGGAMDGERGTPPDAQTSATEQQQ